MKVLAIAPYEGLKDLILSTAREYTDMQVDVYIGDMDQGAEIARQVQDNGYDVIISRGGTAEKIERISCLPVVDIEFSEYDIISTLRLAQNHGGKFSIMGFPSMTHRAHNLCEILNERIDIITLSSFREVEEKMEQLQSKNYSLIIGDVVAVATAQRMGINAILITSNRDNIKRAFAEARRLYACAQRPDPLKEALLQALQACDMGIALFDESYTMIYNNFSGKDYAFIDLNKRLRASIPRVEKQGSIATIQRWDKYNLKIQGKRLEVGGRRLVAYYIVKLARKMCFDDKAISIDTPVLNSMEKLNYFTEDSKTMAPIVKKIRMLQKSQSPVLICGEVGTGKDAAAALLHAGNLNKNNMMITIHCAALTEAQWHKYVDDSSSPLNDLGYTIYFRDVHSLSPSLQTAISQYIDSTALARRHYLLASSLHDMRDLVANQQFSLHLYSQLGVFTLHLPSLAERREDIPGLIALMIGQYNIAFSKNVVGLAPDALKEMVNFHWKLNLRQLEMAMRQLVMVADTAYISLLDVQEVLREIDRGKVHTDPSVDMTLTLSEITRQIIRVVLADEDMNQSRAAKRLGISRSTMWRKLKKDE